MLNFNTFKQKSPQQRFLFILGLVMFVVYLGLGVFFIFFAELDPEKFPLWARLAMGVLLIVYAVIRFLRLMNQKED
ncbi:hypothetical protein ACSBL2_25570 [Pedobacter sp. AW31-3R]|uniref:hypothetical protein n=1 Tax=Pedobacter sp. AW31-3R TaxID=3445781 RepID=UPI003FA06753